MVVQSGPSKGSLKEGDGKMAKVLREAVMGSGKTGGSVPAREVVEAA